MTENEVVKAYAEYKKDQIVENWQKIEKDDPLYQIHGEIVGAIEWFVDSYDKKILTAVDCIDKIAKACAKVLW